VEAGKWVSAEGRLSGLNSVGEEDGVCISGLPGGALSGGILISVVVQNRFNYFNTAAARHLGCLEKSFHTLGTPFSTDVPNLAKIS